MSTIVDYEVSLHSFREVLTFFQSHALTTNNSYHAREVKITNKVSQTSFGCLRKVLSLAFYLMSLYVPK